DLPDAQQQVHAQRERRVDADHHADVGEEGRQHDEGGGGEQRQQQEKLPKKLHRQRPSNPVGLNSRISTTIANETIVATVVLTRVANTDSSRPRTTPPSTAPGTLPRPPRITTMNAFSIGCAPM